jgi:hypothetical protein
MHAGFGHRVNVGGLKVSFHSMFDDGRFALEPQLEMTKIMGSRASNLENMDVID